MIYYVYMVRCSDNYLYTGITSDIERRLKQHIEGACQLTKNRIPLELVYLEEHNTRAEAANREKEIKGWRREKKEKLISSLH